MFPHVIAIEAKQSLIFLCLSPFFRPHPAKIYGLRTILNKDPNKKTYDL